MPYQLVIDHAVNAIRAADSRTLSAGLILGSGLGGFADTLENRVTVDYTSIQDFPVSKVEGHQNRFVIGDADGLTYLVMQGRFHYYEGYPPQMLGIGVRIMADLGIKTVVLTNAAGAVNPTFQAGQLMMITDHINYSGMNPLIGDNSARYGTRFPDMSTVYDHGIITAVLSRAKDARLPLQRGVYGMLSGPSFETPAEIRMFGRLGIDAVGMSTVPEAIVAKHAGLRVVGMSLLTNMAAGIESEPLSHEDVNRIAALAAEDATKVLRLILKAVDEA
ncbi:MAG TPA: purine-nucleoside phosphorylase [Clostridiaceae bacterium]|nr:purine-nucleoside phosphorylase [Clostridiaceae bacterium]